MKEVEQEQEVDEDPYVNIDFFLHRPVLAEPSLCTIAELNTSVTLMDVLSMHEILDFKNNMKEESNGEQQ